jgi:DNA replication protein DnaC
MIRGAMLGARFNLAGFDNFEVDGTNREAFDACNRLVGGENDGVILIGAIGRGKTHLLEATAKAFDERHTRYASVSDCDNLVEVPSLKELMDGQFGEIDTSMPYLTPKEVSRKVYVEFWPMLDLAAALRKDAVDGDGQIVERCMRCDLLLLDDIGREKMTEFILQEFQRIVDYRYRQILPIAVATNLTRIQIAEKYGPHVISRWAHSCEVVDIGGKDRRLV